MKKKIISLAVAGLVTVGVAATVMAQGGRPSPDQQAASFRQSLMTVINNVAGPMMAMQRGRMPYDAKVVARNARELSALAEIIPQAFEHDTSSATDLKTTALPVVWQNHDKFLSNATKLHGEAQALAKAAQGGSEDDVKSAIMSTGAVCGQCHMEFREKPPGGGGGR
ncbi:MAG TPA: cytochrome c [Steroidobacteraceae bacterium]|jgi:cytochrome c556|nr:cytochrome c [Steroidobacteraceae bacterium]